MLKKLFYLLDCDYRDEINKDNWKQEYVAFHYSFRYDGNLCLCVVYGPNKA